jgi:hypothetical protein
VSCDKDKLIKCLEGQKVSKWTPLEDFAVRNKPESLEFKYIVEKKGEESVIER